MISTVDVSSLQSQIHPGPRWRHPFQQPSSLAQADPIYIQFMKKHTRYCNNLHVRFTHGWIVCSHRLIMHCALELRSTYYACKTDTLSTPHLKILATFYPPHVQMATCYTRTTFPGAFSNWGASSIGIRYRQPGPNWRMTAIASVVYFESEDLLFFPTLCPTMK